MVVQYMLEVIGAGDPEYKGPDWADIWANSPEHQSRVHEIEQIVSSSHGEKSAEKPRGDRKFAMPVWVQVYATTKRSFIAYWRTPNYALVRASFAFVSSYMLFCIINANMSVAYRANLCSKYGLGCLTPSHSGISVRALSICNPGCFQSS